MNIDTNKNRFTFYKSFYIFVVSHSASLTVIYLLSYLFKDTTAGGHLLFKYRHSQCFERESMCGEGLFVYPIYNIPDYIIRAWHTIFLHFIQTAQYNLWFVQFAIRSWVFAQWFLHQLLHPKLWFRKHIYHQVIGREQLLVNPQYQKMGYCFHSTED